MQWTQKYSVYREAPDKKNDKEKHIPGYNFCGPGTQVEERLKRGDYGVNDLDNACRLHDVEYMMYANDEKKLRESDLKLGDTARRINNEIAQEESKLRAKSFKSKIVGMFFSLNPLTKIAGYFNSDKLGLKMATDIVSSVFNAKRLGEDIKLISPVDFVKGLNGSEPVEEVVEKGKQLYYDYFVNG
jgi:hypothetical protein